jgi:hypothetical protein
MFIVGEQHKVFAAPEERNVLIGMIAYNIALLWSSILWVSLHIYKHSAPLEQSVCWPSMSHLGLH